MADSDAPSDDNAPPEPEAPPEANTEVPEDSSTALDNLESERDKLNQQAGSDDKLPVSEEGDKDSDAQTKDSRALIKERADTLRAQREAADDAAKAAEQTRKVQKEQSKAAAAQRGTAEQNRMVETRQGSFGEVRGLKPKYKADVDGDTYKEIKPASPWKKWVHRN